MSYLRFFKDLSSKDKTLVGEQNILLSEVKSVLQKQGADLPAGFVLTVDACKSFLKENSLDKKIKEILKNLNVSNTVAVAAAAIKIRKNILAAKFSKELETELKKAIKILGKNSALLRLAVSIEGSPEINFHHQKSSYSKIQGEKEILAHIKKCLADFFSSQAIVEREKLFVDHFGVALAVSVQELSGGTALVFGNIDTIDLESSFKGVLNLTVGQDQYILFKEGVKQGFRAVMSRKLEKNDKEILTDKEVLEIAKVAIAIEDKLGVSISIKWAKDSKGKISILEIESRAEKNVKKINSVETYHLQKSGEVLLEGVSVGQKIAQGKVHIVNSAKDAQEFQAGEILVTKQAGPEYGLLLRLASAAITEQGGKNSHIAIYARELGVPCVVGVSKAATILKNGQEVTVSAATGEVGCVYKGRLPFSVEHTELKNLPRTATKVMVNIANPDSAFTLSHLPNDGVGLAREEFIFTNFVKIHPLALVYYKDIKDKKIKAQIDELTKGYKDKKQYIVDKLSEGLSFLASSFYPGPVQIRLSDFKSNEYAALIGGAQFEPHEDNPAMGWRGASRYYDAKYKPAFELECKAIKKVREEFGLKNIIVTVPFCRTVDEGRKVLDTMKEFGLERGQDGLKVYVMCEIPANIILAKDFAQIFDGFSIGSNDLTQLTLGADRDSSLIANVYNENDAAVKSLIRQVIKTAHQYKRQVTLCGQAASDSTEFTEFLIQEGIDGISLNPDMALKMRAKIVNIEKKVGKTRSAAFRLALATKSLLVIGVFGLTSILGGYGCQLINSQTVSDNMKVQVQEQTLAMKAQLRQEIMNELAKQTPTDTVYSNDSFVKIKLKYPNSWQTDSWTDGVKFSSADESQYFMVFVQKMGHPVPEENITTTVWQGYPARRLTDASQKDGTPYEVLEIYAKGFKKTKDIIELRGDPKTFDDSLKKVEEFTVKK